MASSCNIVPTLTTTQVQTIQSTQTIITSSVSVVQPTTTVVTISTSTICPTFTRGNATPSCSESPVVSSSVIPGTILTVQVTQTSVVPVTTAAVSTLFGTTCVVVSSGDGTTLGTPTTSSTTSTPPPVNTSTLTSMSTASDGNIYTITETLTSASTTSSSSGGSASSASQPSNLGAIVGGAIGGFIGLTVIVLAIWWLMKRRTNWDDIFEKEVAANHAVFPVTRRDPPPDPKPRPYEYGLVGHIPPPTSPPSSTGLSLSSEGPTAHHPQLSDPFSQQHTMGHQDPFSQQQQQVGPGHQGPLPQQQQVGPGHQGSYPQQQVGSGHQGSYSQQQVGPGHQGSYPQQQVGPGHQGPLPQQQQVGPGQQGSYPQQQVGPGQQGSYPQQQVGPSHQDPFPQQQQIGGALQDARLTPGGSGVPVIPLAAPNNPNTWATPASGRYPPGVQNNLSTRQTQGRPSTAGEESDVFGVIDAGPFARPSTAASMSSYGRSHPSVTASSVVSHGPTQPGPSTYEFDPYLEQEQEQQPPRERRDGKGRLITTGEKRPIVHLDGGRYRAPGVSTSTALPNPGQPGAAPPAYSS